MKAVDLKTGWMKYPRSKTAIMRKIPLWPETVEAIREVIAHRPARKTTTDAKLIFIGSRGENYVCGHHGYRVYQEFKRLLESAGVSGSVKVQFVGSTTSSFR